MALAQTRLSAGLQIQPNVCLLVQPTYQRTSQLSPGQTLCPSTEDGPDCQNRGERSIRIVSVAVTNKGPPEFPMTSQALAPKITHILAGTHMASYGTVSNMIFHSSRHLDAWCSFQLTMVTPTPADTRPCISGPALFLLAEPKSKVTSLLPLFTPLQQTGGRGPINRQGDPGCVLGKTSSAKGF